MISDNFYLLSSLPTLGELGSVPPMSLKDLREHVSDINSAEVPVNALLLSDDLLQRQGYLAGEIKDVSPAVLTAAQVRNEQPLPDELVPAEAQSALRAPVDVVWAAYFRSAAATASRYGNDFLAEWVGYEVALRNALAAERAKALQLEPEAYLVAVELMATDVSFESLLAEWAAAPNPLAGLQVLDRARWAWIEDNEQWFSFSDNELTAYAAKLMLLHRWHRLNEIDAGKPTGPAAAPVK